MKFLFCLFLATSLGATENHDTAKGAIEAVCKQLLSEGQAVVSIDTEGNVFIEQFSQVNRLRNALETYIHSAYPWVKEIHISCEERRNDCRVVPPIVLFPPIIGNLFEPSSYFYGEFVTGNPIINGGGDFSMAARIPLVEFYDLFQKGSAFQIDFQAAMQGFVSTWIPSFNLDVTLPITYTYKKWAGRLRLWHYCAHLTNQVIRKFKAEKKQIPLSLAFQNLDLTLSFDATSLFRMYGGLGVVLNGQVIRNSSAHYLNGLLGFDKRFPWTYFPNQGLFGAPYLTLDLAFWPWLNYSPSLTAILGLRCARIPDVGFQYLLNLRYQNGYGIGNFKNSRISTYGLGIQIVF